MQRRCGRLSLSQIDSYEEMKLFFHKGVLLLVMQEDQPVAGALSPTEGGTLIFRRAGAGHPPFGIRRAGMQRTRYRLAVACYLAELRADYAALDKPGMPSLTL
jgi:hypothetical protein